MLYEEAARRLRKALQGFISGRQFHSRVRECYPSVRVHTQTVARADSRLTYGFVAGPGVYETTLTRPDCSVTTTASSSAAAAQPPRGT